MNDEMPWVNLTQEEVNELRTKKHELTEYGKQKLRKFMNDNYIPDDDVIEEMLNLKLAEEKKEELERLRRKETVLRRYNHFYNEEVSGMPHGTPKIGRAHV